MEIEAKFTIKDRETYIQLKNLDSLYGLQLTEPRVQELQDIYLDTPKNKLFAAGYALRQRESAQAAWITLKTTEAPKKGAVHRREELEAEIPPGTTPSEWPSGPVLDSVQQIIGDTPLKPMVRLSQSRVIRHLVDGTRQVAEISLDEVSIHGDEKTASFIELELELEPGGSTEEFEELAAALGADWNLKPQKKSKLDRALELTDQPFKTARQGALKIPRVTKKPKKYPGITPADTMTSAARKTLTLHFRRMLYHEPGTRAGEDIEELHDMRVATRRMRAALPVFHDYLDPDRIKPLAEGLKLTGRRLGAVRDLDVFWEKTTEYLEARQPGEAGDLTSLRKVWEEARNRARIKMLRYLDSKTYRKFVIAFHEFLEDAEAWQPPALPKNLEPTPHHLRLVVPVAVYQRLAEVLAYDEYITKPDAPIDQYHQLRIAAKRLRYTMEYFQEVLGPEVQMMIDRVKALQDHLGDLQDCFIAREILTDFLAWGAWRPKKKQKIERPQQPTLFQDLGVNTYLRSKEREQQILLDSFPHVWGEIRDPYFSHSIAAMVTAW